MNKPQPPYYVAIFTVSDTGDDADAYAAMDARLNESVAHHPGYLGSERSTDAQGGAVSLLYFTDAVSIRKWRDDPLHRQAQRQGRSRWLAAYEVQIARVERSYTFERGR
ncbi:antibiotic biosynthesis monooxygenase [Kribbella qitaiheensis]|uniref:Antibiotic biosynthesis monooxygenase n=1 Tax=Kribbella qitaiheensis TaxID=1544730 RepID=A0A7G6X517_9ACTN|nr:antibiotic biosynthesis monooxygenase [Kribbella qitaiheensis]QNE21332.1 antibiotic biosynthesis monooxygenase [Kribbella qitaiheensis]